MLVPISEPDVFELSRHKAPERLSVDADHLPVRQLSISAARGMGVDL